MVLFSNTDCAKIENKNTPALDFAGSWEWEWDETVGRNGAFGR